LVRQPKTAVYRQNHPDAKELRCRLNDQDRGKVSIQTPGSQPVSAVMALVCQTKKNLNKTFLKYD